jgi:hypothetical protein
MVVESSFELEFARIQQKSLPTSEKGRHHAILLLYLRN